MREENLIGHDGTAQTSDRPDSLFLLSETLCMCSNDSFPLCLWPASCDHGQLFFYDITFIGSGNICQPVP